MTVRPLLLLVVIAACAARQARPIPPRPDPRPLDEAFFSQPAGEPPHMRVHLIDVGQGAATLIEFSCAAVLIDTGGESNRYMDSTSNLVNYLRTFFESRPDLQDTLALVVLTHPHIDHTRGAQVVFGEFKVENLVTDGHTGSSGGRYQLAAMRAAHRRNIPAEVVNTRTIPAGGLTSPVIDPVACPDGDPDIRVLWGAVDPAPRGWDHKDLENENNQSVVVRISLGKTSLLVTGDLELDDAIVSKHAGTNVLDADVYEVGHHGSYNASSPDFLSAVTPKIALIGCGPHNRKSAWTAWAYGHPREVTIERLEKSLRAGAQHRPRIVAAVAPAAKTFDGRDMDAAIYATSWDSDVSVTMYADGKLAVKTRRGPAQ
jgi:competence protein ComEC